MMINRLAKFFNERKYDLLCLLVLVGISFTATRFFTPGVPKLGADDHFPLIPGGRLKEYLHIWSHIVRMFGGPIPMRIATIFPSVSLLAFLENLGLPVIAWQRVEYFLLYLMGSFGTFYFIFLLSKSKIIALSAAVFFVTNPLTLNILNVSRPGMYLWAGYPLMMAFFVRGIFKRNLVKSAILFVLFSLLTTPGVTNPPMLAIVFGSFAIFFLYFFFTLKKKKKLLFYGIFCAFFYLLVNLWWILPLGVTFSQIKGEFVGTYDPVVYARQASSYTSFFALLRLIKRGDSLPLQSGYYGFHFLAIYDLVCFLPAILVMLAPLLARKNRRLVGFYALFTMLGLFLAKGSHPPFRFVYEWLLRHFPGFSMFRTPADKFSLFSLLGYSFLIGTTFEELIVRVKKISWRFYPSLLLLLLLTPAILLFRTGEGLPYEFKYGNVLIVAFIFFSALQLFNFLFQKKQKIKISKKKITIATLFFILCLLLLDAKMFVSPMARFGLLKILVILLIAAFLTIALRSLGFFKKKNFLVIAVVIAISPFVFTNAVNHLNETIKLSAPGGMIPDYYYQARNWLKSQTDEFRLLSLPNNAVVVAYHWPDGGGFGGYDFVPEFFERPVVDFLAGDNFTEPIRFQALKSLRGVSLKKIFPRLILTDKVAKLLRLMNVKYAFIHNDFWWQYYGTDDPQRVAKDIQAQKGIEFEKSFGSLDFYKVADSLPNIYATTSATLVNGQATSLTTLAENGYLDNKPVLIISDQQNSSQLNSFYKIGGPVLLENSQFTDLALDYLSSKYGFFASDPKNLNFSKFIFPGTYEIWAQSSHLFDLGVVDIFFKQKGEILPERTININSYSYGLTQRRWIKIDEFLILNGEYSLIAPELIISARLGRIVLVPKVLREKEEKYLSLLVKEGKITLENYLSPQNIIFSSQKQIFDLEPTFSRQLTVSENEDYQAKICFFRKKQFISDNDFFRFPKFVFSPKPTFDDFKDWQLISAGTNFSVSSREPLVFSLEFKRDSSSPEGVRIEYSHEEIDLEKFPFVAFSYKVTDNRIQNVYLRLFIDTDDNGLPDDKVEFTKENSFQALNTVVFNPLETIKKKIPDKNSYKLVKTEIVAEKIVGVNCLQANEGAYEFVINNLTWLKEKPLSLMTPLVGLATNNDPGFYRYTGIEKKEDFVGYVYQPKGNFGFTPIINFTNFPPYEPVFSFQEQEGFGLLPWDELTIALADPAEVAGMEIISVSVSLADEASRIVESVWKTLPVVDIKIREFVITESEELKLIDSGQIVKGISFSGAGFWRPDIARRFLKLVKLRLKMPSGQIFEYLPFEMKIASTQAVKEVSFRKEDLPSITISNKEIDLVNLAKTEDGDICSEQQLKLDKNEVRLQSDSRHCSYDVKFINIKPLEARNSNNGPKIRSRRLSFSKYLVEIETAVPVWLVFSESYDEQWKAYWQDKNLFNRVPFWQKLVMTGVLTKRRLINDHFLVNVYANGWYIDKVGKYQVILEYGPQKFFELGLLISIASLFWVVGYILKNSRVR